MEEPAVECLAGCDDFAQKQGNLRPACHTSAVLAAFGGALPPQPAAQAQPPRPPFPPPNLGACCRPAGAVLLQQL